jgi:hypothetical protein
MVARSLVSGSEAKPVKVFYSYAREDDRHRAALDQRLSEFKWDVKVEPWYDGNIPPGNLWAKEIHQSLNEADIVLLFVTSGFMRSRYCQDVEVPIALKRHELGEARVIPILVEPTEPDWKTSRFAWLQALPQNGRPMSTWASQPDAIQHVAQALVNLIVQQGVTPQPRKKWKLVLAGDIGTFSPEGEQQLVERLRGLTHDSSLRPVELKAGSIALTMESTDDALQKVLTAHRNGELAKVLDWPVTNVSELFGAGIQAVVRTIDSDVAPLPAKTPDPELMLFPSEPKPGFAMSLLAVDPDGEPVFRYGILDTTPGPAGRPVPPETRLRLVNYFLTGLAACDDDLWVNLAPDERNRMLPAYLGGTALGRVFIDTDYQLKRLCASLLHPDCESGRQFWPKVLARTGTEFGTASPPFASFLRVWIVSGEIVVTETDRFGFTTKSGLRVMAESDYMPASGQRLAGQDVAGLSGYQVSGSQVQTCNLDPSSLLSAFRETILPIVEREIAEGATFLPIREVYSSLILAQWFKRKFRSHPKLGRLVDASKAKAGSDSGRSEDFNRLDVPENREYFDRYMRVFKDGVFYTVRDDYDPGSCRKITRSYFSGAIDLRTIGSRMKVRQPRTG